MHFFFYFNESNHFWEKMKKGNPNTYERNLVIIVGWIHWEKSLLGCLWKCHIFYIERNSVLSNNKAREQTKHIKLYTKFRNKSVKYLMIYIFIVEMIFFQIIQKVSTFFHIIITIWVGYKFNWCFMK